ncbi:MAG: cation diffusion facilitator family transporter [Clostridiales bacterium]|nr:cation diffusion facilitator family transporter [Clostridiales bacterium]
MKNTTNEGLALKVSRNTLVGNILLTAFKLFAGIFARSAAMVSDAVHSLSDVLADLIVMTGIKMSNKRSDKEHPYGHERLECVAGIILSFILFSVGVLIGWRGLERILARQYDELVIPGVLALVAAILSIIVKEAMFWYTRAAAKKTGSVALSASAWHHRSDAMSSLGSFAGIFGARLGFPVLDAVACVIICLCIVKVAIDIFRDAVAKMTDKACDDDVVNALRTLVLEQAQVIAIDQLKTRMFGNKFYVDVEICADGDTSLHEAHGIAQTVHDAIETCFPNVKHCMVHVNPRNIEHSI